MEFFPLHPGDGKQNNLHGSTLIIGGSWQPAVAIGNVGQLAVDLLVETVSFTRVGFLEEPHVLPCVGNDPFGETESGELTTAMEVFYDAEQKLTAVQQRAPVAPGKLEIFVSNLGKWVQEIGFCEVLVLSGADSGKRKLSQMEGDQFRYISSCFSSVSPNGGGKEEGEDPRCSLIGWKVLEDLKDIEGREESERRREREETWNESESRPLSYTVGNSVDENGGEGEEGEEGEENYPGPLRGGRWGFEKDPYFGKSAFWKIFKKLESLQIPVLAMVLFCGEGENGREAVEVANRVDDLIKLTGGERRDGMRWRIPPSWAHLFGPSPDLSLFG